MIRRRLKPLAAIAVLAGVAVGGWLWLQQRQEPAELTLWGNVDLRQISLAFNNSERIAEVLVQEGDRVRAGQVLARLDTARLAPQVDESAARTEAQSHAVERLHRGSRPQEIAQARANAASARADAEDARRQFQRLELLAMDSNGRAVSQQDLDNARFALKSAEARLSASEKALDLVVLGPRLEDLRQAEAQHRAEQARLTFLRQQLADFELKAPADAVVRTRLMEPGELASPQRPVFSLAVTDPKWIRAYVSETELGKLRPGMKATIRVDSFPEKDFQGWVGFISPVAEFTPKSVQTEDLRTSLVYEVRIFVTDAGDMLRLGMPATVRFAATETGVTETAMAPR